MLEQGKRKLDLYLRGFEELDKGTDVRDPEGFRDIRKAAMARFVELGFPSTSEEEWKYTDVSSIANAQFTPILRYQLDGLRSRDLQRFKIGEKHWTFLVYLNGHFSRELSSIGSLPKGVKVSSLAAAMNEEPEVVRRHLAQYIGFSENGFVALNTAFIHDGAFVYVPKGTIVQDPIHMLFLSTGLEPEFVTQPRNLVIAEESSQASIIESHVSIAENTYFTNAVSEIVLGENAVVEYTKLQTDSDRSYHVGMTHIQQARSSNFTSNVITIGGTLIRNNLTAVLDGEGSEATLNGLYLASGSQLVDNHTTVDHAKPHCSSHELYKGILGGKSRGVFNGKIFVRKDAQKTDAKQTNRNLVLSDDATIDTKPQLEIFANDVKCTHGATIGQLDEEAIFYLRSRGIDLESVQEILIYAFAKEIVERVMVHPLRGYLQNLLHTQLAKEREKQTSK